MTELLIHFRRCLHGARYMALELLKPLLIIFLQLGISHQEAHIFIKYVFPYLAVV